MANSDLKLYYFNSKGRAEVARLLLAAAGKAYEDIRLTDEEWKTFKGDTPYGQMPVLEVDGVRFAESLAINYFLARELGFHGRTNLEMFKIDELTRLVDDFFTMIGKHMFMPQEETKKAEEKRRILEEDVPRILGFFERDLKKSGTGYFVGDRLTLVDVTVFDVVTGLMADFVKVTDQYPLLQKNVELVRANQGIGAYMAARKITLY